MGHIVTDAQSDAPLRQVTPRQAALLRLVAAGLSLRGAALTMGIEYATARAHAKLVKRRLGSHTMAHTVAIAVVLGVVSDNDVLGQE